MLHYSKLTVSFAAEDDSGFLFNSLRRCTYGEAGA